MSLDDLGVGKYFPDSPSDKPVEAAKPRRGGRKRHDADAKLAAELLEARKGTRQARKRHDPEDAPVDGDYEALAIVDTDARFEYAFIADYDRAKYTMRGYIPELYGPGAARLKWDFTPRKRGEEIRVNELTLMKCPKARAEMIRHAEMATHRLKRQVAAQERQATWRNRQADEVVEHAIPLRG